MQHSRNPTDSVGHVGQSALDLIHKVGIVLESNDTRTEAVLQRASDGLRAAEERMRALETRAISAETRADEAEKWLVRLRGAIQEKLADGRIDDARRAPGRSLAA